MPAERGTLLDGDTNALPVRMAVTTLTQNILGAGLLSLPFAFKSAGLAGGLALLALIYVLSIFTMGLLVLLANHLGEFSYKGQASETLGIRWSSVVEVWVLCYNLGICVSYPILLGDFLFALGAGVGFGSWFTKDVCKITMVVGICWPLSCAKSLGALKWMSTLGVVGIAITVVAVIVRYCDNSYPDHRNNMSLLNVDTFGSCFPILVGAFGAHYNIPALYREVAPQAASGIADWAQSESARQAFRKMMNVILYSVTISTFVYGVAGVVVYATFGPVTQSDFTVNFNSNDSWLTVVRATMLLAICASFPLSMVSARNAAFNIALKPCGWQEMTFWVRICVTTTLTGLCLALAIVASNIGVVLQYNGSVFGTPVCYIAPALMYLMLSPSAQRFAIRVFSIICVVAGVTFGLLGIVVVSTQSSAD